MIYHLMKYSGKHFNIHFALSRNGGPDWIRELSQWELLQEAEWHLVSRTKRSYVNAVKIKPQSAVLQKRERKRVFNWISYPSNYFQFNYASEVCQNHQKDLTREKPPEFLVIIVIMGVIIGQLRGPQACKSRVSNERQIRPIQNRSSRQVRCSRCFGVGHLSYSCPKQVRCNFCLYPGHLADFCSLRFSSEYSWPLNRNPCRNLQADCLPNQNRFSGVLKSPRRHT
jgi:hypothetical protein